MAGALGPDADDPALTLEAWRARIRRHPGELKSLLRNQSFVAGLGNAYSDEILWAAGLHPFRRRAGLAEEEVELCSVALDLKISEIVDHPNYGVSAFLPNDLFVAAR